MTSYHCCLNPLMFTATHLKYIYHSTCNGYLDKRETLLSTWAVDLKLSVKKSLTIYRGIYSA
jgi:hypothetical protein